MNIYKKILIEKCQIFWAYKNLPPMKTAQHNSGHLSESVNVKRGVKQGCPLSAILFII